jgi:GntR family transcriptional regulator of arabinose operon
MGYLVKEHGRGTFCAHTPPDAKRLDIDVILNTADTYFIHYYIKSISEVLTANNCNFIINESRNETSVICKLLNDIALRGSSGIILQVSQIAEPVSDELRRVFKRLKQRRIPCIMIDNFYDVPEDISYLVVDGYKGAVLAAEHLIERGHKRTGIIYIEVYNDSIQRKDGYKEAYAKAGLPEPVEITYSYGRDFEKRFIRAVIKEKLTAVFCTSDSLAKSCVDFLSNIGIKIPDDFSIIGYDDSMVAEIMSPPLTSVAHPKEALGEMAARALLDIINGKEDADPFVYVFPPVMVIRGSSAAIV